MSLINSISNTYKGSPEFYEEVTTGLDVSQKSEELENVLTEMCTRLSYVDYLTGNKNVDVELLLQIVASYLIGIEQGGLDPESTPSPAKLFEESLFPSLENATTEVITEEIKDGETADDSGEHTGAIEDLGTKQDSD